jgi:hypothetical protein
MGARLLASEGYRNSSRAAKEFDAAVSRWASPAAATIDQRCDGKSAFTSDSVQGDHITIRNPMRVVANVLPEVPLNMPIDDATFTTPVIK